MRTLFTVAAAMAGLLVGAPAARAAEDTRALLHNVETDELGAFDRFSSYESPQDVLVELRFGRYVPNADEGVEGTPFVDIFGDSNRYYGGIEVDWQALRIPYVGTFGPGFGIGYTRASAKALLENSEGRSSQPTSLTIIPMYLVGVLRADVFARRGVPLVPYAKLGFGYAIWTASDADETAEVDGVVGRGASYGIQWALGGMLLLDPLAPEDAREADASIGLNNSYLFAEWYRSELDGFGSDDHLEVGTDTWMVGLALEF